MKITIQIESERASGVAQWLSEAATKIADRATPLPGHSMGDTAAVLKFSSDAVDAIAVELIEGESRKPQIVAAEFSREGSE